MTSHSKAPSSEDFKNISKMINQDDQMTVQKKQEEFDKVVANKEEEICRLKNHNQSLVAQIKKLKNEKRSHKEKLEQLTSKEAMTDKETMTEPVEIEKLPVKKIQTSEKGTKIDLVESLEASKVEESSIKQNSQEIRMPYRHPNHKNRYNQQQDQAKYKQVSMKVDLGWITPEKMQHITSGIRRLYRFVSSSVATTKTKDHEKTVRARTRDRSFSNHALRTKHF
jgi:hypothetical protein